MNLEIFLQRRVYTVLLAALLSLAVTFLSFVMLEPTVSRAVTDDFIITQTISEEISFHASTSDVAMVGTVAGLSGGTSNGTTTVVIDTNSDNGYNLTIVFSTSTAMRQNGGTGVVNNYSPTTPGTPDFGFGSEIFGQFAYRVTGAQAADVDSTFQDNGTTLCGTGSSNTYGACWYNPSTTAEQIINRTSATPVGGSTTTINFRVTVPANPNPAIPNGNYTATATVTATAN